MPKNALGYLGLASLATNQLTSLSRNYNYWKRQSTTKYPTMPRRRIIKGRGRVTNRNYAVGPGRRRYAPPIRPPPVQYRTIYDEIALGSNTKHNRLLTSLSAGDSPDQRDGRFASIMNIRGSFFVPLNRTCRVVIYSPKERSTTMSLTDQKGPIDPMEYTVFFDKWIWSTREANNTNQYYNLNFKKPWKMEYDGTSVSDYTSRPIWIYFETDITSSTTIDHTTYLSFYST